MSGNEPNTPHDTDRLRRLLAGLAVLTIAFAVVWFPGCREYPAVTSKEALQTMKLLYTACNTRDTARLNQVVQRLAKLQAQQSLTEAERAGFTGIVSLAREGKWEQAEQAAFRFAQDQVGR